MIKIGENLSVMSYWEWRAESKLAEWCVGNAPYELPNMVSTWAMTIWLSTHHINGSNQISLNSGSYGLCINGTVGLDSIIAVTSNYGGWFVLNDPLTASIVDVGVVLYDFGRITKSGDSTIIPEILIPIKFMGSYYAK